MMKYWLPVSEIVEMDHCTEHLKETGNTFILLNEKNGIHPTPTLLTDLDSILSNASTEDIGMLHFFTLCTKRGTEDRMIRMLDMVFDKSLYHANNKYQTHTLTIDPDMDPDEIDSSIWQRIIPWIPSGEKRATVIFANVIYGDESTKCPEQGRNIDVTAMGRTLQKIVAKIHQMNGNAFVIYNQEVTNPELSGGTKICVI